MYDLCQINSRQIPEKGEVYMYEEFELNRLEYMILDTLNEGRCIDHYHSMNITELMENNQGALGTRMTVYRKLKKLLKAGYIAKGCIDNHADTFYLLKKGNELFEGRKVE